MIMPLRWPLSQRFQTISFFLKNEFKLRTAFRPAPAKASVPFRRKGLNRNQKGSLLMKWLRFKIDQFLLSFWHRPSGQIHKKKKVGILRLDGMGDLILFLDYLKGYCLFTPW